MTPDQRETDLRNDLDAMGRKALLAEIDSLREEHARLVEAVKAVVKLSFHGERVQSAVWELKKALPKDGE